MRFTVANRYIKVWGITGLAVKKASLKENYIKKGPAKANECLRGTS